MTVADVRPEVEIDQQHLPNRRYRTGALGWLVVLVTCVVAIGSPLLGTTHFFSGDLVLNYPPWSEDFIENRDGNSPHSDFIDVTIGRYDQSKDRLADGDFPEWDPLVAAGTELMAAPTGGAYSPLTLPAYVLPITYAPAVVKLVTLLVSVGGFVLLGRQLGFGVHASLIGGLAYGFSGFQTMWSTWSQTVTGAMVPWVFWGAERLLQRRRPIDLIPLALSTAAMVLGGFPAVVAYTLWTLAAYLLLRSLVILFQEGTTQRWSARIWNWSRRQATGAIATGVAIAVGAGLTAVLFLPFYRRLSDEVLSGRAGAASRVLPHKLLATLAFPHSFGVLNDNSWFGPSNEIESVMYVGTVCLVLGLVALVATRPSSHHARVVYPTAAILVFLIVSIYLGGPGFEILSELPGISTSPLGRMRSVIGFLLALLAVVGADRLIRSHVPLLTRVGVSAASLVAAYLVVDRVRGFASANGRLDSVWPWVFASLVVLCLGLGLLLAVRWLPAAATGLGLLALVGVEALIFVGPYFPRIDPDTSLPETTVHRFLQEAQDDQGRIITHGLTLYPGTTKYFGLRTVNGHAYHPSELKQLLRAFDPDTFVSSTFSKSDIVSPGQIDSPVLDRVAADLAVLPVDAPVFGDVREPVASTPTSGGVISAEISGGALRGVQLTVPHDVPFDRPGREFDMVVELLEDGDVVATSERRFRGSVPAGTHQLPIDGEDLRPNAREVRVWLAEPESRARMHSGVSAVAPIVAADDGLELLHVSSAVVYRRASALPRVRWASDVVVETDPAVRPKLLASDAVGPESIVLSSTPDPRLRAGPGRVVSFDNDDPDRLIIDVDSEEGGWLVVADNLQRGWNASIDGRPVPLVAADHAFASVHVPAGSHEIVFDYASPGRVSGVAVSVVSLVIVLAVVAVHRWSKRAQ